jgi:hypothetical protein
MLYVSLIASAVLLLIANRIVRRSTSPGTAMACTSLAFMVGPMFVGCVLPPVIFQAPLLYIAVVIWRGPRRTARQFLAFSCGATLLAFAFAAGVVHRVEKELAMLRSFYPYVSMEGRLPKPKPKPMAAVAKRLAATETRLSEIERKVAEGASRWREVQLKLLHEYSVRLFVNKRGFGLSRMDFPHDWTLRVGIKQGPVATQPEPYREETWSPGDWRAPAPADHAPLDRLLAASIVDFVHPRGFGYFKDRRHVAGFVPHRFGGAVPGPADRWKVQRLELVSLLLHDEPAVYVSERLPAMDGMHRTPTRPLDRFERFGLEALKRGEDLFVSEAPDGLRMLGAVRSVKQCVDCHGGRRGDLLGAFSYTLKPDNAARPASD